MKYLLTAILLVTGVLGCGRRDGDIDTTIGESCLDDRDCDHRCYLGGHFPGGFCSLECADDGDCPGDTYCMADSGGVCMYVCPPFDCSRLGTGWQCRERDRRNGGTIDVCSGD